VGEENYRQDFDGDNLWERDKLKDLGVDRRAILI
jgi:hypothetical protein